MLCGARLIGGEGNPSSRRASADCGGGCLARFASARSRQPGVTGTPNASQLNTAAPRQIRTAGIGERIKGLLAGLVGLSGKSTKKPSAIPGAAASSSDISAAIDSACERSFGNDADSFWSPGAPQRAPTRPGRARRRTSARLPRARSTSPGSVVDGGGEHPGRRLEPARKAGRGARSRRQPPRRAPHLRECCRQRAQSLPERRRLARSRARRPREVVEQRADVGAAVAELGHHSLGARDQAGERAVLGVELVEHAARCPRARDAARPSPARAPRRAGRARDPLSRTSVWRPSADVRRERVKQLVQPGLVDRPPRGDRPRSGARSLPGESDR